MKSKTNLLREARLDDVEVLAEFNIELPREPVRQLSSKAGSTTSKSHS